MKNSNLMFGVIDLLSLICCLSLLAVFAIHTDQNKGISELDFMELLPLEQSTDIKGDVYSNNFTAIIIDKETIKTYKYREGESSLIGSYSSYEDFSNSFHINPSSTYVFYELETSSFLPKLTRFFYEQGIPVGIASVAK